MSTAHSSRGPSGWAIVFVLLFASFPLWFEALWPWYSSELLVPSIIGALGVSGLPDFPFTVLLWVTVPLGLVLLFRILLRKRSGAALPKGALNVTVQIREPLYIKRVELVQGDGESPYWMLMLSQAVIRNRTKSRVSLKFDLQCKTEDGKPCELPERSQLDSFIKTPESPHDFLKGPVALDSGKKAEGDICFGYAEFPATKEGPKLETSDSQLLVTDRLSNKKVVFDVHGLVKP